MPLKVGVRVFDTLPLPEKLARWEQVGRALLLKSVPCHKQTSVGWTRTRTARNSGIWIDSYDYYVAMPPAPSPQQLLRFR